MVASKAYCGAHFMLCDEGVLIVTSTSCHIEKRKVFFKNSESLLLVATEDQNYFIEPEEVLNLGIRYE